MLSLFPELLFLAPFAGLLMRIALGVLFMSVAYGRMRKAGTLRVFAVCDTLLAVFLIFGFYTQAAALLALICLLSWLTIASWRPLPRSTIFLASVMAFTLLLTGPGPFAFDLPL